MAITDWPTLERPREKLLNGGPESLSDAELLAIFLRTGHAGHSAVDVARHLLTEFGGLRPLLQAEAKLFCAHKGLGLAKFVQLQAALEVGRRTLQATLENQNAFTDPNTTMHFLSSHLRHLKHEVFVCLLLNNKHQLIKFVELFRGTLNSASVYPRDVAKLALDHHAAALIVAHNHPSGDPAPSQSDIAITERLKNALELIDVRLLDHVIVGANANISLQATHKMPV